MPAKSLISFGNLILDTMLYEAAVTFPTMATNAQGTSTLAVPGVQFGDLISWNLINPPLHLALDNISVANNLLTLTWSTDATGISTATVALLLGLQRADAVNLGLNALPAALV